MSAISVILKCIFESQRKFLIWFARLPFSNIYVTFSGHILLLTPLFSLMVSACPDNLVEYRC